MAKMNISSFWDQYCCKKDGQALNKKLLRARAISAGFSIKKVGCGDFIITQPPMAGAVLVRRVDDVIVAHLIDGIYD